MVNDLTLGDQRVNRERIARALDEVEANTRRAGMLHQVAVEECENFDMHFAAVYSDWADSARDALEEKRKRKQFSGQVTKDAIESWVVRYVKEYIEWRSVKTDLDRAKNITKQMQDAWQSRAATLRKLADIVERRPGIDPNMLPRQ